MKTVIYVEGGGNSHQLRVQCQKAFHDLFKKLGINAHFAAKGSRGEAFKWFKQSHLKKPADTFIAMLIDSEDPLQDIHKPWDHLKCRQGDNWDKPDNATDDQVLFMTTCMETWIFASCQSKPVNQSLEKVDRHELFDKLNKVLPKGYSKGKQSFQLLAKIDPAKLEPLPSFRRAKTILDSRLRGNDALESH